MMNETPRANRLHIAIFGKRNAGKSSLINALTNQQAAIVSDTPGTTTDPVYKSMELLPIGPVVLIDTPGLDDTGELGEQRVRRTMEVLEKTDLALLVASGTPDALEEGLLHTLEERNIPVVCIRNQFDGSGGEQKPSPTGGDVPRGNTPSGGKASVLTDAAVEGKTSVPIDAPVGGEAVFDGRSYLCVNAKTGGGMEELKQKIIRYAKPDSGVLHILDGLVSPGDTVVLVTPIDAAAPRGRLILPQQQVLRDVLDHDAAAFVTQPNRLTQTLASLKADPRLVICDSQAFGAVARDVPERVPLTSFSILFSRFKGELPRLYRNLQALHTLAPGDPVLICEGCTHHRQKNDIGSVQIPRILQELADGGLDISYASGNGFPSDLGQYKLIVHCGGCMLTQKEMASRANRAEEAGVPMLNYGMVLASYNHVLDRAMRVFETRQA